MPENDKLDNHEAPTLGKQPNSLEAWLLEEGLYSRVEYDGRSGRMWQKVLRKFNGTVDAYCPGCKREAPFKGMPHADIKEEEKREGVIGLSPTFRGDRVPAAWSQSLFEVSLRCTRQFGHQMHFYFAWTVEDEDDRGVLQKIGQFPSFADLSFPETKRFVAVLGEKRCAEYRKGLGLFSHGANIGAFVYLRRVFEGLVEEAHKSEFIQENWDEAAYKAERMDGRIKMLAHRLPAVLVENSVVYAILSKGVHELSEDECGTYFETVHQGIELMLSEEVSRRERAKAASAVRNAVAQAAGQIAGRGATQKGKAE